MECGIIRKSARDRLLASLRGSSDWMRHQVSGRLVGLVHSEGVPSPDRNSWDRVSAMLRKRGVERLGMEQEGRRSCQVDFEWRTGAPSRSGVASRLCVEYRHSVQQ